MSHWETIEAWVNSWDSLVYIESWFIGWTFPCSSQAPKEAMTGMAAELLVSAAEDGKFENKLADAVQAQEWPANNAAYAIPLWNPSMAYL